MFRLAVSGWAGLAKAMKLKLDPMMQEAPGEVDQEAARKGVKVSIIVPVFDEVASISELVERTHAVFSGGELGDFEILFIDDGSIDGSWKAIAAAHDQNPTNRPGSPPPAKFWQSDGAGERIRRRSRGDRHNDGCRSSGPAGGDSKDTLRFSKRPRRTLFPDGNGTEMTRWRRPSPPKFFNALTCRLSGIKLHDFNCGF